MPRLSFAIFAMVQSLNERFRSSETVERVILDETECTFLYDDGEHLVFMHSETFEQISIKKDMVGERAAFLQDGMIVTMSSHEGIRFRWNCLIRL